MVMSGYIPSLAEMRGPYGQYQQRLRAEAPGAMGDAVRFGSPYRVLEEAGMGGFASRFAQYLLGAAEQSPQMWAPWLTAQEAQPVPIQGGFRQAPPVGNTTPSANWASIPRWQDITRASMAFMGGEPTGSDWTPAYQTPEAWIESPFAPYLGAMDEEGYTGSRNLEQRALARAAMGGPTRGFLGGLANQRAGRYRNIFEREQLEDPTRLPEEAYLGWLSKRLPSWAPGYQATAR